MKKDTAGGEWEMLQLRRLVMALILFLTVFLGKKIYPEKMADVGVQVTSVLESSIDFEAVFSELGQALSRTDGALAGLGEFCLEVFGPQEQVQAEQVAVLSPQFPELRPGTLKQQTSLYSQLLPEQQIHQSDGKGKNLSEMEEVAAVGTVLIEAQADSLQPPEGNTLDMLSLGELAYVAPVTGCLNSGYGYRDHPVNGQYSFHSGVDIDAEAGDPITAFAAGTVEYVGEDDTYGRYLRLDHGNGIKSFYAHCQSLCVQAGQSVQAGEAIAIVGSTGRTTGPHLHFELKCNDVHIDPAYYLDFPDA